MIAVRPMRAEDLGAAQGLLAQLGYPLDDQEVRRRYEAVRTAGDHAVMIGEQAGRIVALCHVFARPALDKPPEAIVQALVVDTAARGSGAGRSMMAAAEAWALDRGFTSVALASSVTRGEAHAFYAALGYQRTATSHLFRKMMR